MEVEFCNLFRGFFFLLYSFFSFVFVSQITRRLFIHFNPSHSLTLQCEVAPIDTNWQHVRPHALFADNIASKAAAYLELVKAKCTKFQMAVPDENYFDSICAGAISGKILVS
jgi:hypothetical protein